MRFQLTPKKRMMLAVFLGLFAFYAYTMQQVGKESKDPLIDADIIPTTLQEQHVTGLSTSSHQGEKSQTDAQKPPITITYLEREDLKSWNLSHGYSFSKDRELYESYTSDVLNDLAKNNDMLALDILANRALEAQDEERAATLFWQATALGSTVAFGQLSHLVAPQPDHKGDTDYGKPKLIESLAILKTAALRGDIRIASVYGKDIKRDYERYYGPLTLTSEDLNKIDQLSQINYDNIQKMRMDLGFGEFENTTPKFLQDMYGQ